MVQLRAQFPPWPQTITALTGAVQSFAASTADRGLRCAVEVRRQLTLDLATKRDIEMQGRMTRKTVTHTLNQFLENQSGHDEALIESVRTELRELLASLIAALDEDMFEGENDLAAYDDDTEDDADNPGLDLVSLDDLDFEDEDAATNYE